MLALLWLILFLFTFGTLALIYILTRRKAKETWKIKFDRGYRPKVSILVPTYNEEGVILFKLRNLTRLRYPKDLIQIVIVDSASQDQTINTVRAFQRQHPSIDIKIIIEKERKGKSAALNFALAHCEGEVIAVSDADAFWPQDILLDSLPYLADPEVGAISGPKALLNSNASWATQAEAVYLDSLNLRRLGESKMSSTIFFEGGFSVFKKETLGSFDPYHTGSDDNGTVVGILEKGFRALSVPEGKFFTIAPRTWKTRMIIKVRRANQLVRVLHKYAVLLLQRRIRNSKIVILLNIIAYLITPITFVLLLATTILLVLEYPLFLLVCVFLAFPKLRVYLIDVSQSYIVLFSAIISTIIGRRFIVWDTPDFRASFPKDMFIKNELI